MPPVYACAAELWILVCGGLACGSSSTVIPLLPFICNFTTCIPGAVLAACPQESEAAAGSAQVMSERVTISHPSLPAWLRSKQVAASILTEQHSFLQHLADAGELNAGCTTIL